MGLCFLAATAAHDGDQPEDVTAVARVTDAGEVTGISVGTLLCEFHRRHAEHHGAETAPVEVALRATAQALLGLNMADDHGDTFGALLEAMRGVVPPDEFFMLMEMIERCPLHLCDAQICVDDDDPECAHLRSTEQP